MLDFFALHPATRILLWMGLAALAFSASWPALSCLTVVLALLLFFQGKTLFFKLLRRIRWILFSLLLIYAFETPGEPLFQFGPTLDGLLSGLIQGWRIMLTVGLLAFLQETTKREEMLSGLYTLLLPLKRWIRVDRIAVRLMLTLHYAEEKRRGDWRERMRAAFCEGGSAPVKLILPIYPFRLRDGAACLALAAVFWL